MPFLLLNLRNPTNIMKKIFYPLVFALLAIIAGCTGRVQIENQIDCNVDPDEYFGQSYKASDFQFWRVLGESEAANIIDSLERVLGEIADDEANTELGSRLVPVPDTAAFGDLPNWRKALRLDCQGWEGHAERGFRRVLRRQRGNRSRVGKRRRGGDGGRPQAS